MILSRSEWSERAHAHAERVDVWIQPHLARRLRGEQHPVHDFLFTYYSQRPGALRRWHPGHGVRLADAPEYADLKGYLDGAVSATYLASQRGLVEKIRALLAATLGRPAHLGCFGLHEWAMVYRGNPATSGAENAMRHDWPLRLGGPGTDEVVESSRIVCSHFDAFRFFTAPGPDRSTPCNPGGTTGPRWSSPGACTRAWICTSTRSG